jgi:hypothetical protein
MGGPVKIRIIDYLSYLFRGIYYPQYVSTYVRHLHNLVAGAVSRALKHGQQRPYLIYNA